MLAAIQPLLALLVGVLAALMLGGAPVAITVLRRLAPFQTWRLRRWFQLEGAVTRPRELQGEIAGRDVLVKSFGSDVVVSLRNLRVPDTFELVRRRPGAASDQLRGDERFDRWYVRRSTRGDGQELLTAQLRERLVALAEGGVAVTVSNGRLYATVQHRRRYHAPELAGSLTELADGLEDAARDPHESLLEMIQSDPVVSTRWAAIEQLSRLTPATEQLRRLWTWAEKQPDPEIRLGVAVAIRDRARIDEEVQRGEALPVSIQRAAALLERMPAPRY